MAIKLTPDKFVKPHRACPAVQRLRLFCQQTM
jgi:hypothetical protein